MVDTLHIFPELDIVIRKGTSEDIQSIFSLITEFSIFQKTPKKVTITPEQMLAEKDFFEFFVAENNKNEIVGFASFFFAYYSWSGKALYLDDLYVKENYRNHNIGTKLIDTIISHAKQERCKKVRWQVSNWNTNAINFYKKMGAEIDEVEINCDLNL